MAEFQYTYTHKYDSHSTQIGPAISGFPTGASYYRADVPDVAPGIYELQVKGTSHEGPFAARRQRIVLVHPPRKLTRDQERESPWGRIEF